MTLEHFRVTEIGYDENREINRLEICNSKGTSVYRMQPPKGNVTSVKTQLSEKMRFELEKELERTGVSMEQVLERYHLDDVSQMHPDQYRSAMRGLKKSKSMAA